MPRKLSGGWLAFWGGVGGRVGVVVWFGDVRYRGGVRCAGEGRVSV